MGLGRTKAGIAGYGRVGALPGQAARLADVVAVCLVWAWRVGGGADGRLQREPLKLPAAGQGAALFLLTRAPAARVVDPRVAQTGAGRLYREDRPLQRRLLCGHPPSLANCAVLSWPAWCRGIEE